MLEAGEVAGDGLVDAVQALGAGQLVVEDVGPGIAPLCGSLLDLRATRSAVACVGIYGKRVLCGAVLCDDMRAGGQLWFDGPAAAINWLRAHSHPLAHGLTGPLNRTSGQLTLFSIWSLSLKSRSMASMSASLGVLAMKGRRPNLRCILCMAVVLVVRGGGRVWSSATRAALVAMWREREESGKTNVLGWERGRCSS